MDHEPEGREGDSGEQPPAERPRVDPDLASRSQARSRRSWGQWVRWVTIIAAGLVLGLGTLAALQATGRMLAITFLGITIASALDPLVDRLEVGRMPRTLVVVLIYAVVVGIVVILGFLIVPVVLDQAADLIDRAPQYAEAVQAWIERQGWLSNLVGEEPLEQLLPSVDAVISGLAGLGGLLALPVTIARFVAEFILVIFISIYWLILTDDIAGFVGSLFPKSQGEHVLMVIRKMGGAMGGYLRGVLINSAAVGLFSYVGLLLLGVNYALVLGAISAAGEIIPVVGPFVSGAVIVIVALFQSPQKALFALGFVILMQQLENNLLVPVVMKSQVDISPLLTLIAVTVGGVVGGLLGAVVALPLAAALTALVRAGLAPAIRRRTGAPPVEP